MIEVDLDKKDVKPGLVEHDHKESDGSKEKEGLLPNGEKPEEKKSCTEKLKTGVKKFLEFKKGIVFFTYETENFD